MKRIKNFIRKGVGTLESAPTGFALWLTSFGSLIIARIMVENWLAGFESQSLQFLFYEFTHTFFFFLLSFLIFWPMIAFFGKTTLAKASNVLLFGFLIILMPPILDTWIANGAHLWSFYKFDSLAGLWHRYLTLFGDRPDIGITYGVRVEVVLTTLFFGLYTYIKTHRLIRALVSAIAIYSTLFILGTFPSWLTFMILGFHTNVLALTEIGIAQLFLSPPTLFTRSNFEFISALNIKMSLIYAPTTTALTAFYLWRYFPKKFFALLHNARIPQIVYHGGLFLAGIGLAIAFAEAHIGITLFNSIALIDLLIAIGLAWLASVVVNDLFDQNIDALTNKHRPLQQKAIPHKEYKAIGMTFFLGSLIFAALVSFKVMLLLFIYQALAWIYSAPPLRLKQFPIVATFFAAIACLLILMAGFTLVAPNGSISQLPASFLYFFAFALMASLPLKDFKDIKGDRADNVYTIPVLFGEQWAKMIIGSAIFISYMVSVSLLHEQRLFWWALLCGSLSFWILNGSELNEKKFFSYRKLPGWLLSVIALYIGIAIAVLS